MLLVAQSACLDNEGWKLDSGATQHICRQMQSFSSYLPFRTPKLLQVGKAQIYLRALGEGTVVLWLSVQGSSHLMSFTLSSVWYCPECPFNLLSAHTITAAGNSILLEAGGAVITSHDKLHAISLSVDAAGLYSCLPVDCPPALPPVESAVPVIPCLSGTGIPAVHIFFCFRLAVWHSSCCSASTLLQCCVAVP